MIISPIALIFLARMFDRVRGILAASILIPFNGV